MVPLEGAGGAGFIKLGVLSDNHSLQVLSGCCIVSSSYFFGLRSLACSDLGEVIRPQHTDGIDDNCEGDHQLDGCSSELTGPQSDSSNHDHGLGDTLTAKRRQKGGDDAIHQGTEKAGHNRAQVESSSEDDDVLGIEHFV